jgi:hypothetical protein
MMQNTITFNVDPALLFETNIIKVMETLDLSEPEFTKLVEGAKDLYAVILARVIKEPAESSTREKQMRALKIQIAILGASWLSGCPEVGWIMEALAQLRHALRELERGFTLPVLQARKRLPSAPRESDYQVCVKTASVLAWRALCRLGVTKTKSAQMIADCITNHRFLPPRRSNQASVCAHSVLNWARRPSSDRWDFSPINVKLFSQTYDGPKQIMTDLKKILEVERAMLES